MIYNVETDVDSHQMVRFFREKATAEAFCKLVCEDEGIVEHIQLSMRRDSGAIAAVEAIISQDDRTRRFGSAPDLEERAVLIV